MASIFKIRDENGQIIEIPAFRGKQGEPGIQGDKGEDGVGIQSIEKTNTDGLVDTYTITMTDGSTNEFTVTNGNLENLVTPQMFGAVGDGVADDTEAVQAALDAGGIIYFPAGRYKTTRLLTVSKSCRIEMFKQYPNTYKKEYPLTPDDNWMGARIDTYSPDGGMIIGDAVEVDGLYIRAMEGFAGVVLKFDNTIGTYTYPASARLKHIKLEIDSPNTIPVSMFDFLPDGSYHYILEDICLGRNGGAGYCEYGFRTDMTQTPRKWANNVIIRNLCIDLHADYPLYIAGDPSGMIRGWVFDVLTIQSYVYTNNDKNTTNRTGHINLMTLKNLHLATFIGSYLWDVQEDSLVGDIISAENVTSTSAIGCSPHFDVIEGYLSPKMKAPENLNLTNLEMTVTDNVDGTANTLRLSDGTNEKIVDIPKVEMSDEHIGSAINTWMDANAEPREEAGKNKFNPEDDGCFKAFFQASGDKWILNTTVSTERWVTGYIKACAGDIIRVSYDGALTRPHQIGCYNANNEVIDVLGNFAYEQKNGIEITAEGTVAIRVEFYHTAVTYENRINQKICITVNNADVIYEDYYTELVGGIGNFMALQSPNGEKYTLAVTNDGDVISKDEEGNLVIPKKLYVTPQMFGAKADGVTDDTEAVQTALNQGGVIYFPAGVYKVTKQLTTAKPCKIMMFKQYPSQFWRSGNTSGRKDYPIVIAEGESDYETEKGWGFGARIDCYPSEGEKYGLLIGDGCEVDGLFMRAMNGFSGVLLAYDNSYAYGTDNLGDPLTYSSYPSAARFEHIRLDCDRHHTETTIPESMFDFNPHGKYFYIFDDIVIGHQDEFATYGFRSIIDEEATWANSVRLKNLCIDGLFDYPLYIVEENTKHSLTNWIFDGMTIQTYGYTYDDFQKSLEGHKTVMTLKRLNYCHFTGCYIWDLYAAKYTKLFDCENLNNISCVGCSEEFYYGTKKLIGDSGEDGIETVLKGRLQEVADDANVKTLAMNITTLEDGSNRFELTDNHGNTIGADIPAVSLSDEQLSTGIGDWLSENADPVEVVGKNKLNIYSEDMRFGYGISASGKPIQGADGTGNAKYLATHWIPAKCGDVFRMSCDNGVACNWSDIYEYNANYGFLGKINYKDEGVNSDWSVILKQSDTAYIRVSQNVGRWLAEGETRVNLEAVERANYCITINNPDISYEPYNIELVGGLSQYFLLQSPNGTQYSVAVTDDGRVVGKDKDGNVSVYPTPTKVSELENDTGYVTADDIPKADIKFSDVLENVVVAENIELFNNNETGDLVQGGYTNTTGYTTTFISYASLPPIDISGYNKVTVKVTSYTPVDSSIGQSLYKAFLDADLKTIEGTRDICQMYGIQDEYGKLTNYTSGNLALINTQDGFKYGMTATLVVPEGAKYLSLFNFKKDDKATVEVYIAASGELTKIKSELLRYDIPTKTSQLENDSGFITEEKFTTQAENEEPTYSEELVSANGWVADGWTGDFANGFAHTTGNTTPLVFTMPEETAQNTYRISFRCSESIAVESLMVKCGNSDLFDLYGQPYDPVILGIVSVENGNLEFVPASTFKGTITDISIKRVIGFNPTQQTITDSTGEISCEMRTTKSSLDNVFIGKHSGENNISGVGCVAVGSSALKNNTSGFWNVGVGLNALRDNTVGSRNVGIGYIALAENITGTRNIALGTFALNHNKTGNKNIAIGSDCLDHNVSGSFNVGIGFQTLYSNVSGNQNTAIGAMALKTVTGNANVGIGYSAGTAITTGSNNFALGVNSLYKLKTGNDNVAIGAQAGRGQGTTTGFNYGVFIGRQTGYNLCDNANANVFIGNKAGYTVTTGGDNICIGSDANTPTPTTSRWVNIGGLYEGSAKSTDKYAKINGGLQLSDIPTTDPAIAGRVWNDNGTLKVSAG